MHTWYSASSPFKPYRLKKRGHFAVCPGGLGNECNGHGQCSLINTQLVCTCNGSFAGVACDKTCPTIDRQVCSNQGTCSATGECLCNTGWSGLACNLRASPTPLSLPVRKNDFFLNAACPGETSNPCSSQGLCLNGMCSCFEGYTGANCSIECTGGSQNPCSRNGRCLMDGSCVCFPGFRGPDCSLGPALFIYFCFPFRAYFPK